MFHNPKIKSASPPGGPAGCAECHGLLGRCDIVDLPSGLRVSVRGLLSAPPPATDHRVFKNISQSYSGGGGSLVRARAAAARAANAPHDDGNGVSRAVW